MKRVPPPLPPRGRKPTPSMPGTLPSAVPTPGRAESRTDPPRSDPPSQRAIQTRARAAELASPPMFPRPVTPPPIPVSGVPGVPGAAAAAVTVATAYKANLPPMRPPMPSDEGFMTAGDKLSLAEFAYVLRDEQVKAKIALYRADLQTNPELDAITMQVVAELRSMQDKVEREGSIPPPSDVRRLEAELINTFTGQLKRLFREGKLASVFERKLAEASKRFARLFFESELHEKIRGSASELKTFRFAEQALFRVLTRFEQHLLLELESFEYESSDVLDRSKELFESIVRELRNKYLVRTTPELNALVSHLNEVLSAFLTVEFPSQVPGLAAGVVKEAQLSHLKMSVGYKVSADGFTKLRAAFERHFLTLLVPFVEERMLERVRARDARFRIETIRFVADPHIFSDVCELICDATYDFLYNEGFLDLPADWRARLTNEA